MSFSRVLKSTFRFAVFVPGLALVFAALLGAAPDSEVAGEWTAQTMMGSAGSEIPIPTTFIFEVEGEKLTGAVHSSRGKFEIVDGKTSGDSIVFSIWINVNNVRSRLIYDGRMTGDRIDFISKFQGGDRSDQFVAKPRGK